MRTEALRSHCERLCREHEIQWRVWPKMRGGLAVPRCAREIETTPVKGPVSYAMLSREIGHVVGRYQDSRRVVYEASCAYVSKPFIPHEQAGRSNLQA
jgi:hypothetical protein